MLGKRIQNPLGQKLREREKNYTNVPRICKGKKIQWLRSTIDSADESSIVVSDHHAYAFILVTLTRLTFHWKILIILKDMLKNKATIKSIHRWCSLDIDDYFFYPSYCGLIPCLLLKGLTLIYRFIKIGSSTLSANLTTQCTHIVFREAVQDGAIDFLSDNGSTLHFPITSSSENPVQSKYWGYPRVDIGSTSYMVIFNDQGTLRKKTLHFCNITTEVFKLRSRHPWGSVELC